LAVLRICKAVGINHQNVSFAEMERTGWVRGKIEHPQKKSIRGQILDRSRSGTQQISRILSRADELSRAAGAQHEKEERHELRWKRFVAKELVNPVQDLLRFCP